MHDQITDKTDVTEKFKNNQLNAQKGDLFEIEFKDGKKPRDLPENPIFEFVSVTPGDGEKGHSYEFHLRRTEAATPNNKSYKENTKAHRVKSVRKLPDHDVEQEPTIAPARVNMQENKNDVTQAFQYRGEIGAKDDKFTIELKTNHSRSLILPQKGGYRLRDWKTVGDGIEYRFEFLPGPNDSKWKKIDVEFLSSNDEVKSIVKIEEPESRPTTPHDVDTQQGHEPSDLSTQDQRNESSTASENNKLTDANASDKLKSHLDNYEAGKESEDAYMSQLTELLTKSPKRAETEGNDMWPLPLLKRLFDKHFSAFDRVPLAAQQEFVSDLPDDVQELILAWKKLGESEHKEKLRQGLASKFAAILEADKSADKSADIKAVDKFLGLHAADKSSDNPLYSILLFEIGALMKKQTSTKKARTTAMRFDRNTLIGLVDSLNNKTVRVEPDVIPPLLDILSESFAQEFYSLRETEQLDAYQCLGNALFDLVGMMEKEAQEPYYWRLFSYMREAWGHIAHKIEPGTNESGGARGYLKWMLEKVKQIPDEKMRELFVISLMIGDVKYEPHTEIELVHFLVDYVWQATGAERHARRMRIDNAIPAGASLHYKFLQSFGYRGETQP